MLERYLSDVDALREDPVNFPRRHLAVVHSVSLWGENVPNQLRGRGDRDLFLYASAEPSRRDRSIAKVPIADTAPVPSGTWAAIAIVFGHLTPGSGCAFVIAGEFFVGTGPYRPTLRGKRWRSDLRRV